MPKLSISDGGQYRTLIIKETRKMQKFPQVKRNILTDIIELIAQTADRHVHIITGRTKSSIRAKIINNNMGEVYADFGAKWEERRGGSHRFMTMGAQEGKRQSGKIAQLHLNSLVIQDQVKAPRSPKYTHVTVGRHGEKIYHYRGRSGRTGTNRRS